MVTPKPTQKPVPSNDIKDLLFNSGLLDTWATSIEHEYIDRFGSSHLTAAGMEWIFTTLVEKFKAESDAALRAIGYITIDSFQQGAKLPNNELTIRTQLLRDERTGEYYRWDGALPKQVFPGSTPESTGGLGQGKWVSVGDGTLRSELSSERGGEFPAIGVLSSLAGASIPIGINSLRYEKLMLINWKFDGDFSLQPHTILSEPVKNEFNEYVLTTDKGSFTFVTPDIEVLRGGQIIGSVKVGDARGWGYTSFSTVEELGNIEGAYNNEPNVNKALDYCDEVNIPNGHAAFRVKQPGVIWSDVFTIRDNKKIHGNNATWYLQSTGNLGSYYFFHFKARGRYSRVYDLNLVGDRKVNTSTGEWGYGFATRAYKNLRLINCSAIQFVGDGFLAGLDTSYTDHTNEDIVLIDCYSDKNGRQGLSIAGGQVHVIRGEFSHTDGTAPMAGIDIEPDANKPADLDVRITGTKFNANAGPGILITLQFCYVAPLLKNKSVVDVNIVIDSPYILNNSSPGFLNSAALRIVSGPIDYDKAVFTNRVVGRIQINGYDIIRPAYTAISIDDHYSECVPIHLTNGYIEDVSRFSQLGEEIPTTSLVRFGFRSGVVPTSARYKQGRVTIDGLEYFDYRGTTFSSVATYNNHRLKRPILNLADKPMTNVSDWLTFRNFKTNIRLADGPYLFWRMYGARYEGERVEMPLTGSWLGQDSYNYGEGVTTELRPFAENITQQVELPLAASMIGSTVTFIRKQASTAQIQFNAKAEDKIRTPSSTLVNAITTVEARGVHRFYCLTSGVWVQM